MARRRRHLRSFVAQFRGEEPEVPAIPCIDPVETAADKLSAFAWRVLARKRDGENDDPTIVRHVCDMAVLEAFASADARFGALLNDAMLTDASRGSGVVAHLPRRSVSRPCLPASVCRRTLRVRLSPLRRGNGLCFAPRDRRLGRQDARDEVVPPLRAGRR